MIELYGRSDYSRRATHAPLPASKTPVEIDARRQLEVARIHERWINVMIKIDKRKLLKYLLIFS